MKRIFIIIIFILIASSNFITGQISIIPKPVKLELGESNFTIDRTIKIYIDNSSDEFKSLSEIISSNIEAITGFIPEVTTNREQKNSIQLLLGNDF